MRSIRFFSGITLFLMTTVVNAQTVKELDVETKAELKSYMKAPADYRTMLKSYTDQIEGYEVDLNEVKEDYYKMEYAKKGLEDSITDLNNQINALQTQLATAKKDTVYINTDGQMATAPNVTNNVDSDIASSAKFKEDGVDYRVQVGAYKRNEFDSMLNIDMPVGSDVKSNVTHYYVGSWDDPIKANEFADVLRTQKIKGAFVTKYVDGERVFFDYLNYIK